MLSAGTSPVPDSTWKSPASQYPSTIRLKEHAPSTPAAFWAQQSGRSPGYANSAIRSSKPPAGIAVRKTVNA